MPRYIRRKQKAVHKLNAEGVEEGGAEATPGDTTREQQGKPQKKPPLTHFLCIPLVNDSSRAQLEASLQHFRDDVHGQRIGASTSASSGHETSVESGEHLQATASTAGSTASAAGAPHPSIAPKAIRPLGTMHLTLGVMSLQTPERVQEATSLLHSLDLSNILSSVGSSPPGATDSTLGSSSSTLPPSYLQRSRPATSSSTKSSRTEHAEALAGSTARSHQGGLHDVPSAEQVAGTENCGADVAPARPDLSRTLVPPTASDVEPLKVSLRRLQPMQKAQKTSILFAVPEDPTGRLLRLGTELRRVFTDAEVMVKDDRPLKLHATIVNTIYAKPGGRRGKRWKGKGAATATGVEQSEGKSKQAYVAGTAGDSADGSAAPSETTAALERHPEETRHESTIQEDEHGTGSEDEGAKALPDTTSGHGPDAKAPLRFNATGLIERYKDFVWAEGITIDKVAICKMGAKKILNERGEVVNEEYEEIASVALSS